jgi:N utilization substance protein A
VSVLIDYGLTHELADKLSTAGISTIEQLGSMTPEQLEEIPGFGEELDALQAAVNNYYGQFEQPGEAAAPQEEVPQEEPQEELSAEPAGEAEPHLAAETGGPVEPASANPAESTETTQESDANDSDTISSSASSEEHVAEEGNSSRPSSENRSPEE